MTGALAWVREHRGILLALLVEVAVFAVVAPSFLDARNQVNVLRQISINAVIAAGMTFVILTGGIDLSVGSIVSLAGVSTALAMKSVASSPGPSVAAGIGAGLATGLAVGALNGLAITQLRVPPFIATLASMTMARGAAYLATGAADYSSFPTAFAFLGRGWLVENVLPFPVLVMAVVFALSGLLLTRTRFGRHVYALGGSEEAARLSGISVRRTKLLVYALSGICSAVGGLLLVSRLDAANAKYGEFYELDAIAAVVVGGASLSGGKGSIGATLVGALIIGELNNGLNLANVESYTQKVVLGAVILASVAIDQIRHRAR